MNLSWSNRVIKYILFVFNLLFVISGIIMISVGVSVKTYYTDYDIFLSVRYFSLPNLLIAIGSLIFFISFFGCCGAIRESWFMIFIFSILLSVIFIMEFAAGISGYVLRDDTASYLEEKLSGTMKDYKFDVNNTNSNTRMWDIIQKEFQCCGTTGPKDWTSDTSPTTSTQNNTLPSSQQPSTQTKQTSTVTKPSTQPPSTVSTDSVTTASSSSTISTPASVPSGRKRRAAQNDLLERAFGVGADQRYDLPWSCCQSRSGASGNVACNFKDESTATYYKRGCVEGFGDYLKEHAVTIGGVGIAIALIQLFGVIFACHLSRQLKHGFYST